MNDRWAAPLSAPERGDNHHHAWAKLPEGEYLTEMRTTWVVPSIPKDVSNPDVFIYLWPGGGSVLQPVLAFHAGYPKLKWYLHTYAIHGDESVKGDDYDVEVGVTVVGVIKLKEITPGGKYTYRVFFEREDGTEYPPKTACEQTWPEPVTGICQYIEAFGDPHGDQYPAEEYLKMCNIKVTSNKGPVPPQSIVWDLSTSPKAKIVNGDLWLPYRA
ncbi:hypothetical protein ACFXPZ_04185 [Streptomyces sp. NPDC059101]|uniref:hypothetical protein n=1 Tax=unclassified Streptomyces TaxID=2593676 RepID=UPI00368FECF0